MASIEFDIRDALAEDDIVLPFSVDGLEIRGRVVRLGPALDAILKRHEYPAPVSAVLGQAISLTALLGTSLKFDGRFILQTQTDGPIDMLIVDFRTPAEIRAYARYDEAAIAEASTSRVAPEALLGSGRLAMTVDQGSDMSRYQGIVPLDGASLEEVAHTYFRQSEQIPTRIRLAVAEAFIRANGGGATGMWRAGGILIQHLPHGQAARQPDLHPGDAPEDTMMDEGEDNEAWDEATILLDTVEDHELIDPGLASERLLYRLFHERGVRVFERQDLVERCHCSRGRIETIIRQFSSEERASMIENGRIEVTCEFCNTAYAFDPAGFDEPQ